MDSDEPDAFYVYKKLNVTAYSKKSLYSVELNTIIGFTLIYEGDIYGQQI